MAQLSAFDVLGPNMIGPSSSHTAGAAVIAYLAQKMINGPIIKATFTLYGSFALAFFTRRIHDRSFSAAGPAGLHIYKAPEHRLLLYALLSRSIAGRAGPPLRSLCSSCSAAFIALFEPRYGNIMFYTVRCVFK